MIERLGGRLSTISLCAVQQNHIQSTRLPLDCGHPISVSVTRLHISTSHFKTFNQVQGKSKIPSPSSGRGGFERACKTVS